ncbi:oligosaccharide flippase family protein [Anaerocolumna sedimenticola]|uniref:Oligosaccharide flippase family protein n=1 Tax=Anaerocolumna sedimenticola TaxID=2696063 RepID=A0A6P1TMP8_9FIRM|nr:oligosaccharide flippase family protein [Anaerocolumna sedimenticola]QHQ61126.1 oligosaccharide flippase family protein [Anaerocolumna sedimenticola]
MSPIKITRNASKFIWNTMGIMCNAGTSFLLLIFVTRICGDFNAGIFALGFANAQLMLTIGRYGMRVYQATDMKGSVRFSTYYLSRILTCACMLIISLIYILWSGYTFTKAAIVFSICIIKMADALEDVFHGLFQQNGRIDVAGKYLTARNLITLLAFIILLVITKDLLLTCVISGLLSVAACFFINVPTAKKMTDVKLELNKKELVTLFISCFPLFIGSFLALYINNIPKYMIDRYLTEEIQAFFNILFMPAFVINLFSEFIFKPLLTDIAIKWEQNQVKSFVFYIIRLMLGILIITVIVVVAGYFVGIDVLTFVYGVDLLKYRNELILLLISGGFGAGVYLLFHVLTAMRRQVILLAGYTVASIIITAISPVLVQNYNIFGASIICFISSIILFLIFLSVLVLAVINKIKTIR